MWANCWEGGDMTSLHTFLHTQYVYVLGGGSVSSPSVWLSVESQAKVCMCVVVVVVCVNIDTIIQSG